MTIEKNLNATHETKLNPTIGDGQFGFWVGGYASVLLANESIKTKSFLIENFSAAAQNETVINIVSLAIPLVAAPFIIWQLTRISAQLRGHYDIVEKQTPEENGKGILSRIGFGRSHAPS